MIIPLPNIATNKMAPIWYGEREKYDLWLNEIELQKPACAVATIDDGHGLINLHVQ